MKDSRISGLYRLSVAERIDELERLGWLPAAQAEALRQGRQVLSAAAADSIVENVVGVFGLPFGIAANFRMNGQDYLVPMVVEEPSIVAASSNAARLARNTGGFAAACDESLLAGQLHVIDVADAAAAIAALDRKKEALRARANSVHPRLALRGGGVRDVEIRRLGGSERPVIVVHFLVDTCDAMGANLVNTICESVAPDVQAISGGKVVLRILSNFADRSLVTASVRYRLADLAVPGFDAEDVRDGIVAASEIAAMDPYRAVTHNKGVMNGIDALAVATGNDWRAIEAGAHAHASVTGRYLPLATWKAAADGDLEGTLCLPIKAGIVGGTLAANPAVTMALGITGVTSARELAMLMGVAGLAQNFGALQALATAGIQDGHMRLHARSVVAAAGVPTDLHAAVVDRLREGGDIKSWRARKILDELEGTPSGGTRPGATAAGKVILLGEHAAVYGRHALALPISDAVSAVAIRAAGEMRVSIPEWGIHRQPAGSIEPLAAAIALILRELDAADEQFTIEVRSRLPRAMGLGASAALAVSVTRAIAAALGIDVDDERVNSIAFACEKLAHGTPSGVDNTIATYARPMLFRNAGSLCFETVALTAPPPLVIAFSSQKGFTREQVAAVRARRDALPGHYESLFDEIDALSRAGAQALEKARYAELGALMNVCHGLLNSVGVSTPEIEGMLAIARAAGACGAKLTGSGGGGAVVALCPGTAADVDAALRFAGFATLPLFETANRAID